MSRAKARYLARQLAREEAESQFLTSPPPLTKDTLWRGLTRSGELRLIVARATRSVNELMAIHGANADAGRLLAELSVGGMLVRSAMDPDAQVQLTVRNSGGAGTLYLDLWPSGRGFRASVQHPEARESAEAPLFCGGEFDLVRSRAGGTPHRSVRVLTDETLSEAFMAHLLESDQVRVILQLDVQCHEDGLTHACGFLVQLTPEGGRRDIEHLLGNLEQVSKLSELMTEADPDGREFGEQLLAGYRWDQSARESVAFVCRCSRERLVGILRSLPDDEVQEMIDVGEPIETTCEFCRARYEISPGELR